MTQQLQQTPDVANAQHRDITEWNEANPKRSHGEMLAIAARRSGLSPLHLGRDFMRHSNSGRGIQMTDYLNHQLWDMDLHPDGAAELFVGATTHWPVCNTVNSKNWWASAEDKVIMQTMLTANGLTMPETLAVVDTYSARHYPGIARIEDADGLRDLVLSHPPASLFAKTLDGMIGRGAVVIEAADDTHVTFTGFNAMTWEQVMHSVFGNSRYLIQKRLENHPSIAPFCSGIASVRLPAFIEGQEVLAPLAALRMPWGGNITCAYWRKDNLACGIDPNTGQITRVAAHDGPFTNGLRDHPETPGLVGLQLPYWDKVRALHEAAARVFADIPYQSTDIALTPKGPVLIELNYAGSFNILQNATGKGLLQPPIKRFFEKRGVSWTPGKRRGLFGMFGGR